jgi:hypothetical protein
MSNLNKTPQELKEIFEWYAEWVTADLDTQDIKDVIFNLCDNLTDNGLQEVVGVYEWFDKKEDMKYICGCCGDHTQNVTWNEDLERDECNNCLVDNLKG